MKTFLIALILAGSVLTFVICNAFYIGGKVDELLATAQELPADAEAFEATAGTAKEKMEKLWQLWDACFERIAFTSGYDNLNRADDAMLTMYVSFQNENTDDFMIAKMTFCDALKRLKLLESFSLNGIL